MLTYRKGWIQRRAACLMTAFGIDHTTALREAILDWLSFCGSRA